MVYHQRLLADHVFPLDKHDSLYVPSAAVRDNDTTINPLGQRRFTIIRELAQTQAVQVGIPDLGHISTPSLFFGVTPMPFISIIDHLNCPTSVYASIGNNIYSFAQSVYQVVDIHARVGSYYPSFSRSFNGIVADGRYFDTILFLDALLQHYSSHSVLPQYLVHDLTTGCFYAGLARTHWAIHLRKAQGPFDRNTDHRVYITESRIQMIKELPAQSYAEMTDDQLQLVTCTIQQLLVEHALYLHGPMSLSSIQAAEDHLRYQPPSRFPINHGEFLGFNVQELHSNLLKFHYHKHGGILYSNAGFSNYARVFLAKLDQPISPFVPDPMLPWMRWMRHVLNNVVKIIENCSQHLTNYLIEDKNRVSFLAFEFVLRHLDALTLPVVENWDKTLLLELRLIFITYNTNISYSTGIRTIFLSDQQLSTFAFDRPPDSLQTSNPDYHKGASTSSSSSSPSSSSRTSSQTVPHEEYFRQLQMMRTEIETLKAALLQKDRSSPPSLDTDSLYIQEALRSSLTTQDIQQWNRQVYKRQCAPIPPTPYISRDKEPGYNYSAEFYRDSAANVRASIAKYHAERLLLISRANDSPLQCPHVAGGRLPKLNFDNIGHNITEYTHAFRLPHATFLTDDLQQIHHLLQNGSMRHYPEIPALLNSNYCMIYPSIKVQNLFHPLSPALGKT
jgi:hypothetical protein